MTLNADDIRLLLAECMEAPKPCLKIKSIEYFDAGESKLVEINQSLDDHTVSEIVDQCVVYEIRTYTKARLCIRRVAKGSVTKIGYELDYDQEPGA